MKPHTPILPAGAAALLLAALAAPAAAQYATPAATDSVKTRLILRAYTDFGHIIAGTNHKAGAGQDPDLSMQPLSRTNFLAIQEVASGNFDVAAGLSGLVWWPYGSVSPDANERVMNVKPMVPVARVRWRFGEPAATSGALLLGTFSHKYNPDAKNLGEYLYRSGTYPGFLFTTEGWLLMNRAGNYSHGALLSLSQMGGVLRHNFSLFMEMQYYPVGDFSPGYDVSYTRKWFEMGAGAVLNHYLALKPSALEPRSAENTYVHVAVDTGAGQTIHYYGPDSPDFKPAQFQDEGAAGYSRTELHRWSYKGVKVMGRAALNLNSLLPADRRNPEDLRIFGEVAVLGWEDQPLYYENRSERMPVMFGVNVPTFKLLDVVTLQGEYYASPFNDISKLNDPSLPIWASAFKQTDPEDPSTKVYDETGKIVISENHKNDWKWSVYAKKTINRIMTVHAQAASDHLRLTDGKYAASNVPLTSTPSEWYYLVRLEFSLR
jgi:hypothetical protein